MRPQLATRTALRPLRQLLPGAGPRVAPATASLQTRACSQCHSVKEWKENHGAWSRTAATSPALSAAGQTRACSQCRSVKEWKENHAAWSRAGPGFRLQRRQQQQQQQVRAYASEGRSVADEKIEEITELFNTAKDEFELAYEETEKNTTYAADDRAAAEEEFAKMQEAYAEALSTLPIEVAEEIKRRIGSRIRELEEGMKRLNEMAIEH